MSSSQPTRRGFLVAAAGIPVLSGVAHARLMRGRWPSVDLVDDGATAETRSLFAYLKSVQGHGILFGHQNDTTYGFSFETPDGRKSDTLSAVGDHPALFGWDTLILEGKEIPGAAWAGRAENEASFIRMVQDAHRLGGISTVSAHLPNFVNGTDFNDTSGNVVVRILPGGDRHSRFRAFLDGIARVFRGSVTDDGTPIPIIFRPWHENNGDWFWWGAEYTTPGAYIELFRFTVEYLRDTCSVNNLLYAYSPAGMWGGEPTGYMRTYPGDRFVDVLGYDSYDWSAGGAEFLSTLVTDLRMIVELADSRGKVPAYTEFGEYGEENQNPTWFTDLLSAISVDPVARRIAYMQTWANWGGTDRAYVPFPAHDGHGGHPLLPDFRRYAEHPRTLFADDVAGVFSTKTRSVSKGPFMHLVTPTDRERVATAAVVVRARITGATSVQVFFNVDNGAAVQMTHDKEGFWSATWEIDPAWLDNRSVTVNVMALVDHRRHIDSVVVLLGERSPLPHGWVDDFEGYAGDDAALSEMYSHFNSGSIALTSTHKASGNYGLTYAYDVGGAGYAGIGKAVDQDWSAYTALKLWVQGDGSSNGATLQIVADGAYFEHGFGLHETSGIEVIARFADFVPAPWDTEHRDQFLDVERLATVTRFNLYIGRGGDRPTGTVYFDDIRAM
ncbi:glycosyl hydrolase [Kocuria kalidii]|uniref:glycosyl hydrolase n=1 Tax=Kocuria kalidii TaxID=3376283 RepID=UPI0037B9073C